MSKQLLILGLVLGGCAAAVACGSDNPGNTVNVAMHTSGGTGGTHSGGEAGVGTTTGGGAGASEGGAPDANGGTGATAGAGEGGEAGAPVVVVPPALPLNPNTVVVTSAPPATLGHVLLAGLDFAGHKAEVASVKLQPAAIDDSTIYTDPFADVTTVGSGGLGFVLQRSIDKVSLVEGSKIKTTFDVSDPGTGASVDLAHKAYVPLFNKSLISVLDLTAGTVARRIDLSEFDAASDSDGSVDATAAMYDATKKIAYFVLARIDLGSFDANFHLPCNGTRALVVGVDATTDAIVDLNGAAAGKGIPLSLVSPNSAELSANGNTITVLSAGCYVGDVRSSQGVELVHLDTLSSTIAYAPTDDASLSDLILVGGQQAVVHSFLSSGDEAWNRLDLTTGTLGATLANVPSGPVFDGTNLLGVSIDPITQAASVVRYSATTDTSAPIIASPWVGKYDSTATTALVQ